MSRYNLLVATERCNFGDQKRAATHVPNQCIARERCCRQQHLRKNNNTPCVFQNDAARRTYLKKQISKKNRSQVCVLGRTVFSRHVENSTPGTVAKHVGVRLLPPSRMWTLFLLERPLNRARSNSRISWTCHPHLKLQRTED